MRGTCERTCVTSFVSARYVRMFHVEQCTFGRVARRGRGAGAGGVASLSYSLRVRPLRGGKGAHGVRRMARGRLRPLSRACFPTLDPNLPGTFRVSQCRPGAHFGADVPPSRAPAVARQAVPRYSLPMLPPDLETLARSLRLAHDLGGCNASLALFHAGCRPLTCSVARDEWSPRAPRRCPVCAADSDRPAP